MARNFDLDRQSRRFRRLSDRFERLPRRLNALRLRFRRSPNGIVLGVFRGIAESLGWSVCWTRVAGCVLLLAVSGDGGHSNLLVAGFFYLLAAVLMRGPELGAGRSDTAGARHFDPEDEESSGSRSAPPPQPGYPGYPARAARRPAAVPFQRAPLAPRVDFATLDRQLEALNHRIQRMEGIVTDRHYDWDRRMES